MDRAALRHVMVGTLALAGAAVLLVSLVGLSPLGPGGQSLRACFDDVGGLESGDPVYLRGVHVGRVSRMELDADYRPCATLDVDASLRLADDTSAVILTKGVLGDRCVDLEPGGSDTPLRDGDEIDYTQSAMVLERMVGRVLMDLQDQR